MIDIATILEEVRALRRDILRHRDAKVEPIVVGAEAASKMLGISISTLNTWVKSGLLKKFIVDGVHRFRVADLQEFVAGRMQ